jgi:hypothetical protein
MAWPSVVVQILDVFSTISAPSLSLVSVDCALTSDQAAEIAGETSTSLKPIYGKFIMQMLVPVIAVVLPGIFWTLYYAFGNVCVKKRQCKRCCKWTEEITEEDKMWYHLGCVFFSSSFFSSSFFFFFDRSHLFTFIISSTLDEVNAHQLKKRSFERYKVTLMVNVNLSLLYLPSIFF